MVEIPDIKDSESLKAWLEGRPREVSVWIAARSAARVMPQWWDAVLTEEWARKSAMTALPVLRSLLISSVAACRPNADFTSLVYAAGTAAAACTPPVNLTSAPAAAANAAGAAFGHEDNFSSSASCVPNNATSYLATFTSDSAWHAVRMDAEEVAKGQLPDALSLWHDVQNPFEKDWIDIKAQVAASPDAPDWQFWLNWYDAQLAGRTMLPDPSRTWDMLEQIALIKPETWDAGPDTVSPLIREIWKLHRLRSEVAALQAEKDAFLATRASEVQRSHNQPPDGLVDDQPELARQITIVGNSLDEARDALEQDAPDKSRLRDIANRLLSALTAVTKYCAKVADTAVISAAKLGGGAGGAAMVDYFANNGRLMQFAKDLLSHAAGV